MCISSALDKEQQNSIFRQLAILRTFLHQQVTSDYVYLDVPGHLNVGDHLIAMGAWELLKEIPYKCLNKSTVRGFDYKVPPGSIVLLHGGGNFGDLYPGANWFRNEIVKQFPNNKIIFLPQTVTYKNTTLINDDASICSRHANLHICGRDSISYHLLCEHFSANNIYLIPDTALGLYNTLNKQSTAVKKQVLTKKLLIQRRDFEKQDKDWEVKADDIKDWDEILQETHSMPIIRLLSIISKSAKHLKWPVLYQTSDSFLINCVYPTILKNTRNYFLQYDKVYTTRLHGLIFAAMLHIPVEWQDTKFGKISNYVATWMRSE